MRGVTYRESQRFVWWAYGSVAGVAAIMFTLLLLDTHSPADMYVIVLMALLLGVVLGNVLYLRVEVRDGYLRAVLGAVIPCFWRNVPLDGLRDLRIVTYRPIRDAGGWGYRWGRFESQFTTFINARGNRGVLIETPKGRYLIGSQEPEKLADAIARAAQP